MAGNTKLVGFGVSDLETNEEGFVAKGLTGAIHLERWGEKVEVPISPESLKAIRFSCYEQLPMRPPPKVHMLGLQVGFDPTMGMIALGISSDDAEKVIGLLEAARANTDELENSDLAEGIIAELKLAAKDRDNFHSSSGEPGLDSNE
jgi:hypothetical protein